MIRDIESSRPSMTQGNKIVLYKYRFVNLAVYFLLNVAVSCVWVSISIVQPTLMTVYDVSNNQALFLTNIFYFLYIPGTILSAALLSRVGFMKTTALGGSVIVAATLCRALSGLKAIYGVQILGAILGGFAQPLVLNGCSQLSATWFGESERNAATMLGETVPAALGGAVLGVLSGSFTVNDSHQLAWYFWAIFMFACFATLLFVVVYKATPKTPASFREHDGETTNAGIFDSLKLFANPFYALLVLIIGIDYSLICTLPTVIPTIFGAENLSDSLQDNGIAAFLFAGITGALVAGFGVDFLKQKDVRFFQWTITFMNAGVVIFMALFLNSLKPNNGTAMLWLGACVSFFATGVIPVGIEAAAEITFPAPEGASAGYLIMMGNLIAAITIQSTNTAVSFVPWSTMWATFALSILAFLISFAFRPKYKRTLFEQGEKAHGGQQLKPSLDAPLLYSQ